MSWELSKHAIQAKQARGTSYLAPGRVAQQDDLLLPDAAEVLDEGGHVGHVLDEGRGAEADEGTLQADLEDGVPGPAGRGVEAGGQIVEVGDGVRAVAQAADGHDHIGRVERAALVRARVAGRRVVVVDFCEEGGGVGRHGWGVGEGEGREMVSSR